MGICDTLNLEYGIRRISQTINSIVVLFTESNNNTIMLQAPMRGCIYCGDAAFSISNIAIIAETG
ncbi:hypothetical protein NAI75_11235, partial [Francisella tularensis subsp. holarctica]|nr:hypothetical protein [Francisella tularensis subsp. holarctica]